jgi:hypothetical protein
MIAGDVFRRSKFAEKKTFCADEMTLDKARKISDNFFSKNILQFFQTLLEKSQSFFLFRCRLITSPLGRFNSSRPSLRSPGRIVSE